MENTAQRKRSARESLERVDEYLQNKRDFVTLTTISQDLNLHFDSIKKCVQTLEKFERVIVATNGNIVLVKFTGEKNGE
jgi:predicted transcriptional regulator